VTRNLIVLVPALTTSTAAAIWIHLDQIESAVTPLLIPLFHLGALLVFALLASIKALRPLRTEAHRGSQPTVPWLHVSPAILWLAAQLFASLSIAFQSGSDGRPVIDIVLLLGATLTTLAIWAWWRLNVTFMGTVWNYCRFNERAGLIRAMTAGGAPPAER